MNKLKEKVYSHLPTMTMEDYQKYVNEADLGYIKINKHQEDENIVILNYTEMATFEKRWNEQTKTSRGLILDLTEAKNNDKIYILAKPFEKFPNYGENPVYEKDIDFNKIDYVMEKMDGSLGISYFFKDEIRFATRGSFHSEQAVKATEMWRERYEPNDDLRIYAVTPVTYLVEIIYPENRIVVDYKGEEKLVLLGVIYLFSKEFLDLKYNDIEWEADRLVMPIAPKYELTVDRMLELKKSLSPNEEGFVIRFKNGKRLKIKGDEYINVHRLLHGVSDKAKFYAWSTGGMNDYIMQLPEEFRPELEEFSDKLDGVKDWLYILLQTFFEMIKDASYDKKSFAIQTNDLIDKPYRKFMFDAYKNGSVSVELIREHIYKNYTEYLEVITWNNQDF